MRSVIPLSLFASLTAAQSLLTPISYTSTLEAYYYFRNGSAGIQVSNEGITITGTFQSTEDICSTLDGAQVIYFADGAEGTLLTSNCWNVYYMATPDQKLLSWSSCEEFPFYESICGPLDASTSATAATSATSVTSITSNTNIVSTTNTTSTTFASLGSTASQHTTTYQSGTAVVDEPVYKVIGGTSTVVTTTLANGDVTSYTTFCPITNDAARTTVITITSCSENKCSEVPVTTGVSLITKVVSNVLTTYTTYCPLTTWKALETSISSGVTSVAEVAKSVATTSVVTSSTAKTINSFATTVVAAEGVSSSTTAKVTITGKTTEVSAKSSAEIQTLQAATSTSTRGVSSAAAISTFEGSAEKLSTFSSALALAVAALFF
jgi:hypothetical protein